MNSIGGFSAAVLTAGVYGFNFTFLGERIYKYGTIGQTIKLVTGQELISSQHPQLFVLSYKKHEQEIKNSAFKDILGFAYDRVSAGNILEKWCNQVAKKFFLFINAREFEYSSKWCVEEKTIATSLVKQNKHLAAAQSDFVLQESYMDIFSTNKSTNKSTNNFLKKIIDGETKDTKTYDHGWQALKNWCDQALYRHESSTHKSDAEKFCVIQPKEEKKPKKKK